MAERGRFAPTPSGRMHLGNVFSALLAWLSVRAAHGELVLRIEDLDTLRCSAENAEILKDDLRWLGLTWDAEQPDQSTRSEYYESLLSRLLSEGFVYPCWCTRGDLKNAANAPHASDGHPIYPGTCRDLTEEERAAKAQERAPLWRLRVPDDDISFTDGHYGSFTENIADSGDFIIRRSDGVFAYQLAVSFDDMDMGVDRVVRGRDILPSTARQIWLISELGGKAPEYCHAPLLVTGGDRKLSKRFGDLGTDKLLERYSPEELIGYLGALLGISDGASVRASDLIDDFDWSRVIKKDILIE